MTKLEWFLVSMLNWVVWCVAVTGTYLLHRDTIPAAVDKTTWELVRNGLIGATVMAWIINLFLINFIGKRGPASYGDYADW